MQEEFVRFSMMFGETALDRLSKCHVMIFGIGGVGSFCAEALARAGVGNLTLVDNDTVGTSNINRQIIALHSTIGQYKSQVMADRILDINPECNVRSLPLLYNEESKGQFFDGTHYDYIVDAIDLVSCKLSLIQTTKSLNIPIISAMGTGNKLDPSKFQITDISKTKGCPLARVVRKELKNRGIYRHTVLFSEEEPQKPIPLETPPPGRRAIPASVSWTPSVAGLMMAGHVVQDLLK